MPNPENCWSSTPGVRRWPRSSTMPLWLTTTTSSSTAWSVTIHHSHILQPTLTSFRNPVPHSHHHPRQIRQGHRRHLFLRRVSEVGFPGNSKLNVRPRLRVARQEPRARRPDAHFLHLQRRLTLPSRPLPEATGRHVHPLPGDPAGQPVRRIHGRPRPEPEEPCSRRRRHPAHPLR
jgi:hypothetical protein